MNDRWRELCDVSGTVSRETFDRLTAFETELRRWNERINLAALSTIEHLWGRHILDSAQLVPLKPGALHWVDLGSGGGFPGAVIAILLADRPGAKVDLIESNHKKAAFLRSVLNRLQAPAVVHCQRIEASNREIPQCDVVTARALAPLPRLFGLAEPWLQAGATALFHKGRDYESEVAESRDAWEFDLIEHISRIDPASRVLECVRLKRRGGRS